MSGLSEFVSQAATTTKLFFLIGAFVGIAYALDGWRGSSKDVLFWKSPRVKNFLWVVGTAFSTFLGQLKRLHAQADQSTLLLAYLSGFLLLCTLVVLGWGCLIGFKFAIISFRDPGNFPPPPFSPFLDYIQYGYEYYRQEYERALKERSSQIIEDLRGFLHTYSEKIALAMAAANSRGLTDERRKDVATLILQFICDVVVAYKRTPGLEVNSNYMSAIHASKFPLERQDHVRFAFNEKSRYEFYLALGSYARDVGAESFILPVEKKGTAGYRMSLPGAPLAFLRNDLETVDDVEKVKYRKDVPQRIRKEIDEYFKTKEFRSFGSLNIARKGKQLGIVNVESNRSHVFGRTQAEKKEFSRLLQPFCWLLGELISPLLPD